MSFLSKLGIAASIADFSVKKLLQDLISTTAVAAAGSDQTDATALTAAVNFVTASDGTKGVILPVAEINMQVEVINTVSNQALKVYPNTSAQINSLTATTGAFTQAAGSRVLYVCDALLHWYCAAANLTGVATSATQAELDAAAGVTLGTAIASKNVTTDANIDTTGQRNITITGSFIVGSASMNETDLEKLDGITNGTQAAGKAVVADTNVNTGVSKVTQLWVGASGSEVQVDATPLEVNRATDLSARLIAAGATETITLAQHSDRTVLLDTAGGSVCTLPLATGTGARLRFVVTVRPSGASHIIKVGNASDFIAGQINLLDLDSNAVTAYQGDGAADDTITINNTTTGGAIGDSVELEDTLTNVWTVIRGALTVPAGSNVADPFSATV